MRRAELTPPVIVELIRCGTVLICWLSLMAVVWKKSVKVYTNSDVEVE